MLRYNQTLTFLSFKILAANYITKQPLLRELLQVITEQM